MASTVSKPSRSTLLNSLDDVRPQPAKAGLAVNRDQVPADAVVKDALVGACGSLKSAAISMVIDQGQLTRELQADGPRIGKLIGLPPSERGRVFDQLHDAYGSRSEDPRVRLRREIRELRARADAIADLAEEIAS